MVQTKFVIATLLSVLWFGGVAQADPIDMDAISCSGGDAINGVSLDDVNGLPNGGASDCFGTFSGNDPSASGDGIETGGMVFDFIARTTLNDDFTQSTTGAEIGLSMFLPDGGICLASGDALTSAVSSGCWSYDPDLFSATAFIVVLKAANDPGWAAWLFEGGTASSYYGDWAVGWQANRTACTGHTNNNGTAGSGNCTGISHLTIFAKGGEVTVSEPGTLALLGLGLMGVGAIRRRRKSS